MNDAKTVDDEREPAPRDLHTAFLLDGITWLPHYSRRDEYVSPGYGKHHMERETSAELRKRGAREIELALWLRPRVRRDRDAA